MDNQLENAANLPPAFIEAVTKRYGGTRLGRQELNAELLEDTLFAPHRCLWRRHRQFTYDVEQDILTKPHSRRHYRNGP